MIYSVFFSQEMETKTLTRQRSLSGYRPDIDGLRAIAVSSVVIFHAHLGTCASGYVGVDIFFVISGYLIAGIIFREVTTERFTVSGFYARRARRILPALIAVVIATMIAGLVFQGPRQLRYSALATACALLGISNIQFYRGVSYFTSYSGLQPMLMTWSLGVEEQFYVAFPLILIFVYWFAPKYIFRTILGLTICSLILSIWATAENPAAAFYLPIFRAWELGIGALIAIGQSQTLPWSRVKGLVAEGLSLLGLALLVDAIFYLNGPFPGWRAMIPVAGSAALILSDCSVLNQRVLSFRPFVGLGLVSYSWYLWHWPLMSFTRIIAVRTPPNDVMTGVAVASLIVGILSWRFIEQPFRQARALPAVTLRQYGMALAGCLVIVGCIFLDHGVPMRVSRPAQAINTQIIEGHNEVCIAIDGNASPDLSAQCASSGPAGEIALLGDSHAHALMPALHLIASRHGYGLVVMTKASCPALLGVTRMLPELPHHAAECLAFNKIALTTVLDDPKIKIVVIEGFWAASSSDGAYASDGEDGHDSSSVLLEHGLNAYVQALAQAGKRVLVMGDVPLFNFDMAQEAMTQAMPATFMVHRLIWGNDGLSGGRAPWRFITTPNDGSDAAVRKAAGSVPGVLYDDPFAQFCAEDGCIFSSSPGTIYYADEQHLSVDGSIRAGDAIEEILFPTRPPSRAIATKVTVQP